MIHRRSILVSAVLITILSCNLPFVPGAGGLSQEEATQRILDEVVQADSVEGEMIVFGWPEPLQSSDRLVAFNPPEYTPSSEAIEIAGHAWFFWIDDAPGARFAHPSRFALVDQASGEISLVEEEWWPTLNGEGLFIEQEDYWNEAFWVHSTVDWRPAEPSAATGVENQEVLVDGLPVLAKLAMQNPDLPRGQARPGRAIVISGEGDNDRQNKEFVTDASAMHGLLTQAGFSTLYLAPDNDFHQERDGTSDLDTIGAVLGSARDEMKAGETLFIYVTSHGYVSKRDGQGVAAGFGEVLLELWLAGIDPGVEIILVIDACYSGSFVDTTQTYIDMTITSTNATDPAYFDRDDDNDPNPEDEGGEFTSGFVEGWREILSNPDELQRVGSKASDRGISFWQALAGESYITATERDAGLINTKSFPLLTPGLPSSKPVAGAATTVIEDPQQDGLLCRSGEPLDETAAEIDIGTVTASWSEDGELRINLEFPRAESIEALVGSVEFYDPAIPNSDPSDTWYFSGRGNFDLNYTVRSLDDILTEVYKFNGSNWDLVPNAVFEANIEGNNLILNIPAETLPSGAELPQFWVGAVDPEFTSCDAAGWDENGQAAGELPSRPANAQAGAIAFDTAALVREITFSNGDLPEFTDAVTIALGADPGPVFAQHLMDHYIAVAMLGIDPEGDALMCGTTELAADAPPFVDMLYYAVGIGRDGFGAVSVGTRYANRDMPLEAFILENDLHHNTFLGFQAPPGAPLNPSAKWHPYPRSDTMDINNKFDTAGYYVTFEGMYDGSDWRSVPYRKQALIDGSMIMLPIDLSSIVDEGTFYVGSNNFNTEIPADDCAEDLALIDEMGEGLGEIAPLNLAAADQQDQLAADIRPEGYLGGFSYELPAAVIFDEGADPAEVSTFEMYRALGAAFLSMDPRDVGLEPFRPFLDQSHFDELTRNMGFVHGMLFDPADDAMSCDGVPQIRVDPDVEITGAVVGTGDGRAALEVAIDFLISDVDLAASEIDQDFSFGAGVEIRNPGLGEGSGRLQTNQVFYTTFQDGERHDLYSEFVNGQWNTSLVEAKTGDAKFTLEIDERSLLFKIPALGSTPLLGDIFVTSTNFGTEENCVVDAANTHTGVAEDGLLVLVTPAISEAEDASGP